MEVIVVRYVVMTDGCPLKEVMVLVEVVVVEGMVVYTLW